MKAATVYDIKEALQSLPPAQVAELCLRLVKFKKENKELLSFLLFESGNLNGYIAEIIVEMNTEFSEINSSQLYFAKKSIRRILRNINKQIRYTGSKTAEVELLMAWCRALKESGIAYKKSTALENLYQSQIKKIQKTIGTFHEDLQYDYARELEKLKN